MVVAVIVFRCRIVGSRFVWRQQRDRVVGLPEISRIGRSISHTNTYTLAHTNTCTYKTLTLIRVREATSVRHPPHASGAPTATTIARWQRPMAYRDRTVN